MSYQSKRWCCTLFNYSFVSIGNLEAKFASSELLKFICQEEKAPSTGKLHLQLYLCFSSNKRLGAVKTFLCDETAHCEVARGGDAENEAYCSKDDTATGNFRVKRGSFDSVQGKRTDLDRVKAAIEDGQSICDISSSCFSSFVKYHGGITKAYQFKKAREAPSQRSVVVIVLWGATGTGKSAWAREYCNEHSFELYSKPPQRFDNVQWFDGYDEQEVLLLDDFESSQVSFRELLVWLDVYKLRVQVKGGMALASWHTVIITSNVDPQDWYSEKYNSIQREPLYRRLDHVFEARAGRGFVADNYPFSRVLRGREPHSVSGDGEFGAGRESGSDNDGE